MEAKVTSTRKLEVYPSKHNKEIETAETIFIEDILKLKNEGDSILLTRRNASSFSCLAYLESRPVEKLVMPKIAEGIKKKKQEYLDWLKLPRYQEEASDEYYADIQAITEDLQRIIDFIDSNFTA